MRTTPSSRRRRSSRRRSVLPPVPDGKLTVKVPAKAVIVVAVE
jgi:hypothetical protein